MILGIGNVGSTSLKTKIVDIDTAGNMKILGEANLDRITSAGESTFACRKGASCREQTTVEIAGFDAGIRFVLDWYVTSGVIADSSAIQAMGFKTVMGVTNGANNLTPSILDEMERFVFVAPVHNGPYLEAIGQFRDILDVPMVGVFEPSFHYSIPRFRRYFGLPWKWYECGIRRLGFHGSSHRYLNAAAARHMGREDLRVLTIHLGGSSSLCAIRNFRSVDISQTFSPNSGVLQGTRCGDTDATAVLYAMEKLDLSIREAQEQLSHQAGLKGMAGIGTDDLRAIQQAAGEGNERAAMTIDLYVDGVRKYVGSFAAVLGGFDCIVFGGGIGENNPQIRQRVLERMEFMGIAIDSEANDGCRGSEGVISTPGSPVTVLVTPTNEEMVVAGFTKQVVESGRDLTPEEMVFRL